jgi:hypothetical protein
MLGNEDNGEIGILTVVEVYGIAVAVHVLINLFSYTGEVFCH